MPAVAATSEYNFPATGRGHTIRLERKHGERHLFLRPRCLEVDPGGHSARIRLPPRQSAASAAAARTLDRQRRVPALLNLPPGSPWSMARPDPTPPFTGTGFRTSCSSNESPPSNGRRRSEFVEHHASAWEPDATVAFSPFLSSGAM